MKDMPKFEFRWMDKFVLKIHLGKERMCTCFQFQGTSNKNII